MGTSKAIAALLKERGGIMLDIGCGRNKQKAFVGLDMRALPGVDIVHDVDAIPWPLPDECVTLAMASHLVEHINPAKGGFLRFMDEVWRVCKYDAQFIISTPYCLSPGYFQDPTHCNPCNENTWLYFDPLPDNQPGALYGIYEPKPWKCETLTWDPNGNINVVLRKRRDDPSYHFEEGR